MSQVEKRSMREGFAAGLKSVAAVDSEVIFLGCDVTRSLFLHDFAAKYPKQYFSIGIAEQNAASVAAGLALAGKKPVFATYAAFATTRALDQIRMSICYNQAKVLIGGAHAGLSVGPDGGSHQALEDIAVMRTLPGMRVVLPADANETEAAVRYYLRGNMTSPTYIRFGRNVVPNFTTQDAFTPGAEVVFRSGKTDLLIIAYGATVWNAIEAAREMRAEGQFSPTVLAVKTLGDGLADNVIIQEARATANLLVVEEHQLQGGVASYVCELLTSKQNIAHSIPRIFRAGVEGVFGQSGTPEELYHKHMLSVDGIKASAHMFKIVAYLKGRLC